MKLSVFTAIGLTSLVTGVLSHHWNSMSAASPTPSTDGFPNPDPDQLRTIEQEAHGTLFNASLPANISQGGLTNLQLIAFNELFEVAFFEQLLFNLTNHVDGYDLTNITTGDFITNTILTIQSVCVSMIRSRTVHTDVA
jgi:hypothetical protein